ncbi:probable G-protein coupled receptor No18 [Ptychodera flava]|uniref:probable G-protein coupled receptor No18 n=1 Tax=Ptychodera flava TaxID=63121 RepID=UPI00396A25B6
MALNSSLFGIDGNLSSENETWREVPITTIDEPLPLWEMILSAIAMVVLLIVTAAGNTFVIVAINTQRDLQQVQNYFLVSLAVADLTIAVFVLPFAVVNHVIGYWTLGYVLCDIWTTSDLMVCTASICHLCAVAIDRYLAITDPINYAGKRTKKNILLAIAVVWAVSAAISVPPLLGWSDNSDRAKNVNQWAIICHITTERGYIVFSAVAAFFLPLLIMIFVYYRIWIAARDRIRGKHVSTKMTRSFSTTVNASYVGSGADAADAKQVKCELTCRGLAPAGREPVNMPLRNNGTKSEEITREAETDRDESSSDTYKDGLHAKNVTVTSFHTKLHNQRQKINVMRERKAATTLGIVMGLFILCWLPYFLMYVIIPFCDCPPPSRKVEAFIVWLGYVNSCFNPVIYTIFNRDFRKAFYRLICRRKYHGKSRRR